MSISSTGRKRRRSLVHRETWSPPGPEEQALEAALTEEADPVPHPDGLTAAVSEEITVTKQELARARPMRTIPPIPPSDSVDQDLRRIDERLAAVRRELARVRATVEQPPRPRGGALTVTMVFVGSLVGSALGAFTAALLAGLLAGFFWA